MVVSTPSPQTRFADRYALIERLHTGASTEVWLAEDQRADIAVALKILDRSSAERDGARRAFEREWQIARALNHPHTVRALDRTKGERPAYAMQYIDGTDFSELAGRPFEVWAPCLLVILDTLVYWHRKGVVHGDLKPANLLLDRRGVAYLADFGSAATIGEEIPGGRRGGSAAYSSPEQSANESPDPADDVYAVAQVIAELASGNPTDTTLAALPPQITRLVRNARLTRASRPSLGEIVDGFKAAGITRGNIDLRALDIALRRPASSVAGALDAPAEALPHGAFERDVVVRESAGFSPRAVVFGLIAIVVFGVLFTQLLIWLGRDDAPAARVPANREAATAGVAAAADDAGDGATDNVASTPVDPDARAAARADADSKVARVLSVLDVLEKRGVNLWGGVEYESGKTLYAEGDRAYLAADYALAGERYAAALTRLQPLTERIDVEFEKAMRAGDAALRAEDAVAARNAFELALAITPGDPLATHGVARANSLNAVLALLAEGRLAERVGDLDSALAQYEEAVALDPSWQPAIDARDDVRAQLAAQRFRNLMSGGISALDEGRFADARRAFDDAAKMRPGDSAPRDALLQVRLAERLQRIAGLEDQARAAEADERWQQALDYYRQMLDIDANLDVARDGVVRVRERIGLLRDVDGVLADPDRLSETAALRDASALLTRLSGLTPRGPQLAARIGSLEEMLKAAAVPIPVTLRSDGLTTVTLLRVSQLGAFESTEVRLRPGLYTLVGSRRGFVDARRQFRVVAGESPEPVYIACEQPI